MPSRTNEYNNSKELSRDSLHWHFPHYQGEGSYPASTIRVGNHLLIHNYHHNAPLPYDIANDPGETKNLMASLEETDAHIPQELSR